MPRGVRGEEAMTSLVLLAMRATGIDECCSNWNTSVGISVRVCSQDV